MTKAKEVLNKVKVAEALSFRGVSGVAKSEIVYGSNAIVINLENGITVRITGKNIPELKGKVGVDILGIKR